jgi:hypothetical protein
VVDHAASVGIFPVDTDRPTEKKRGHEQKLVTASNPTSLTDNPFL